MIAPTRKEVLEGLCGLRDPLIHVGMVGRLVAVDRAIAYLESDPAETLAENYARRMERVAGLYSDQAMRSSVHDDPERAMDLRGRAEGLREAARMLLDKDAR